MSSTYTVTLGGLDDMGDPIVLVFTFVAVRGRWEHSNPAFGDDILQLLGSPICEWNIVINGAAARYNPWRGSKNTGATPAGTYIQYFGATTRTGSAA